jgi:hypothetical protein
MSLVRKSAADVEAHRLDRTNRHLAIVRVNDVRDIDRRAARRQVGRGS